MEDLRDGDLKQESAGSRTSPLGIPLHNALNMNGFCQSNNRGGSVVCNRCVQHCSFTARPRGGRALPRRESIVAHGSGNSDTPKTLQRLVEDLENAIDREEYELAASLRDEIQYVLSVDDFD